VRTSSVAWLGWQCSLWMGGLWFKLCKRRVVWLCRPGAHGSSRLAWWALQPSAASPALPGEGLCSPPHSCSSAGQQASTAGLRVGQCLQEHCLLSRKASVKDRVLRQQSPHQAWAWSYSSGHQITRQCMGLVSSGREGALLPYPPPRLPQKL